MRLLDIFRLSFAFFLIVLASSCGPSGGKMIQQYSKKVREVGLLPIYPPREDFQVGDVYYWSQSNINLEDRVSTMILSEPDVQRVAEQFLNSRLVFSETVTSGNQNDLFGRALQTRGTQDIRALPLSAFPEITADAGFSSTVGISRLLAAIGLSAGGKTTVTLNFQDVRTYGIPTGVAAMTLGETLRASVEPQIATNLPVLNSLLSRELSQKGINNKSPCEYGRRCGYTIVTKVYLTRKIYYTYRSNQILALGRQRFSDKASGRGAETPIPMVNVNIGSATTNATPGATATGSGGVGVQPIDIATLQRSVQQLAASGTIGENVNFQSWDARGLTFSQQLSRPIAIGWDGLEGQLQ